MNLAIFRSHNIVHNKVMFFIFILVNIILFLLFDKIWFKFAGPTFKDGLKEIALIENGDFKPRLKEAIFVYILMALSLEFFVFSFTNLPITQAHYLRFLFGSAMLGFVCFGIYDFTNRAILKDYPLKISLIDTAWGVFVYSAVGSLNFLIKIQLL